jgi:hypothetical protein
MEHKMVLVQKIGPSSEYFEAWMDHRYMGDVFPDELDSFLEEIPYPVEFDFLY